MVGFKSKKLKKAKRVCLRLKEAREAAGLSIEEIAKKTRIDKKYVSYLETCDFEKLPKGDIYHKQFIKKYLRAINVNPGTYLFQYSNEETKKQKTTRHPHKQIHNKYFHNIPGLLRFASFGIISILLISYLGIQVRRILEPPVLVLHSPTNGFVTDASILSVTGETGKEVSVAINGKHITNDGTGKFNERIDLSAGVNTITVSARKKHGKTTTEVRHVILRESQQLGFQGNAKLVNSKL